MTYLTPQEHLALKMTAELWNLLADQIVERGPSRDGDLAELGAHIHAIQSALLSQAGARLTEGRYRKLGG